MKLLIVSTLIATTALFAEGNFAKRKAKILESLDKRIHSLNQHKSCIASASKKEDFKKCNAQRKVFMKENRAKMKEFRKTMKEKRKARRENKE